MTRNTLKITAAILTAALVSTQGAVPSSKVLAKTATVQTKAAKSTLSKATIDKKGSIYVGESLKLNLSSIPKGAKLKWKTSDKNIAAVNKNGSVKAKSAGEVTITCTITKGSESKKLKSKVTVKGAEAVKLNQSDLVLEEGENITLKRYLTPAASDKVKWTSSDESIVKVTKGKITALKQGEATVTAKATSGKTAVCKVSVVEDKTVTNITLANVKNGEYKLPEGTYENVKVNASVGEAQIYLDNVKIKGKLYMESGAEYTVNAENSTIADVLVIEEGANIKTLAVNGKIPKFIVKGLTTIKNIMTNSHINIKKDTSAKIDNVKILPVKEEPVLVSLEGYEGNIDVNSNVNAPITVETQDCKINEVKLTKTVKNQTVELIDKKAGTEEASTIKTVAVNTTANLTSSVKANEMTISEEAKEAQIKVTQPVEKLKTVAESVKLVVETVINEVLSEGINVNIEISKDAVIATITTSGDNTQVKSEGKIEKIIVKGNGTNVEAKDTIVNVSDNITGVKVNGEEVQSGTSSKVDSTGTITETTDYKDQDTNTGNTDTGDTTIEDTTGKDTTDKDTTGDITPNPDDDYYYSPSTEELALELANKNFKEFLANEEYINKANITLTEYNNLAETLKLKIVETLQQETFNSLSDIKSKFEKEVQAQNAYKLKWEEQFNGNSLNLDDWNIETHEPGWVNNELQEYVNSSENIYIEDGNLVLKPIKTVDESGKVHYTSGRINTQNKHDFKYGMFEARLKVPKGQGFLPAFWMMPTNENLYGQWPRCGEIDIMEVLGNKVDTSYGTIHYGNPHSESQGKYTLDEGNFTDEYHVFSAEWEPGKINWYVDGKLAHTENDWYSVTEGQGEITYPAPFDQPFYIILNLAVGGSWPGNPDETTDIENAAYKVDYVKVYQKDSYDENVVKPEKEVILREPDSEGNYVINGKFSVEEDLADDKDWIFMNADEGEATAKINDGKISIDITKEGEKDHCVQLVQPNLPMKRGGVYQVSFDAYADEARTMKVCVSAPDRSYRRYLADTTVDLTTEKKTYTYDFTMKDKDDANGRLEFNLGKAGSTAGVHISNVSIVKTSEINLDENTNKTVLTDGNYVYNGSFQEGLNRLGYWDITNNVNAQISVTNENNIRRLKIVAPEGVSASNPIIISQSELAFLDGIEYALSFDAEGETGKNIKVSVAGNSFDDVVLTGTEKKYNYKFSELSNKNIEFRIEQPGTFYLDNVRVEENSLIKNGSFNAGFSGYEPWVDSGISSDVTYVVDSKSEDNAADFTINNSGDEAWKIQLKQNNVELEKGQWYKLSLEAKSDIDRKIMFAIQRDGSSDDNWTPYSHEKKVDLTSDYQTYTDEFQMKNETDLKSILSISMGAGAGTSGNEQITQKHRICIDNIKLEKIDPPKIPEQPAGENLLKNGDFSKGEEGWVNYVAEDQGAEAEVTFADNKATYNIKSVGTEDWNVQLKQAGITLEEGCKYKVTFKATSTKARKIKLAIMDKDNGWYDGKDIDLKEGIEENINYEFTMNKSDTDAIMQVSMGKIADVETPASTITLSDFVLEKIGETETPDQPGENQPGGNPSDKPDTSTVNNLLKNVDFSNEGQDWVKHIDTNAEAEVTFADKKATFDIKNVGSEDWHVQLKQTKITLEKGCKYRVKFTATSTEERTIKLGMFNENNLDNNGNANWYAGKDFTLNANENKDCEFIIENNTATKAAMQVSMGKIEENTPASTITLSDFVLEKIGEAETPNPSDPPAQDTPGQDQPAGENLLKNGDFAKNEESWQVVKQENGEVTTNFNDGKATYNITNVGDKDYSIQLKQAGITLEKGCKYKVTFKATSTETRTIKTVIQNATNYTWYNGKDTNLQKGIEEPIDFEFTMDKETDDNVAIVVSMGKIEENTPASTITLSDFSLVKVSE